MRDSSRPVIRYGHLGVRGACSCFRKKAFLSSRRSNRNLKLNSIHRHRFTEAYGCKDNGLTCQDLEFGLARAEAF